MSALRNKNPCVGCGYCCRYSVDVDPKSCDSDLDVPHEMIDFFDQPNGYPVMKKDMMSGFCIAFDQEKRCCKIYDRRPQVCRDFEIGCKMCIDAVEHIRDDIERRKIINKIRRHKANKIL